MNVARISANGQITVPIDVRKALGVKAGDKLVFFVNSNGEMIVKNAAHVLTGEMQMSPAAKPDEAQAGKVAEPNDAGYYIVM